jgi:hypothetical protein
MTPESQLPAERDGGIKHFQVEQRFDLRRMIESEAVEVDLPTAMSELIDNSLDQTEDGKTCEVLVTLDPKDRKLYFKNKNTAGMDDSDFQSFMTWGLRHAKGRTYSEHGQGGKLAIVQLLDRQRGNLIVTSQAPKSTVFRRMEIAGWWQRLEPGQGFEVVPGKTEKPETTGYTQIEMDGLKEGVIPTNLIAVADELGQTYAPLLKDRKLSIVLRRLPKTSGTIDQVNVLPTEILFNPLNSSEKKDVPVNKGAIRFDIKWGMIDQIQREKDRKARSSAYSTNPTQLTGAEGEYIYIYNHGRRHDKIPVTALKILRLGSKKITFANFAVVINITEGVVPRTLLKKGLSPSSPERALILDRTRELIAPTVRKLLKEGDDAISQKDKVKVKEASSKFGAVLLGLFNNQQGAIVKEFFSDEKASATPLYDSAGKPHGHSNPGGLLDKHISLPGIRGERVQKETTEVRRIEDAIPELRVVSLGKATPTSELFRDLDQPRTKLVVAINFDNPEVKWALQERGDIAIAHLLAIAASGLYYNKWVKVYSSDAEICIEAIQEDVANFLKKAEELKII